jgi:ribosomal protein L3
MMARVAVFLSRDHGGNIGRARQPAVIFRGAAMFGHAGQQAKTGTGDER